MFASRRSMLLGALALPAVLSLSACSSNVTLADVQRYAATAVAALTAVVPLVSTIDPAISGELTAILTEVQTAEKAFAALTSPVGAMNLAQTLLSLLNQAFTIVEGIPGIPAPYIAGVSAAQILLVTIAAFFGISVTMALADVHPSARLDEAVHQYASTMPAARKQLAERANTQVRAWISSLRISH